MQKWKTIFSFTYLLVMEELKFNQKNAFCIMIRKMMKHQNISHIIKISQL